MAEQRETRKKSAWGWILWWQIDEAELNTQVEQYRTLKPWRSMRGVSALCLVFSMGVTVVLIGMHALGTDNLSFVDVGLMGVLGVFIYLGHRWAMLAAMLLWTAEKLAILASGPGPSAVSQVVWWAIYMHAFYFAFRIEQRRRKLGPVNVAETFS